MTGEDHVIDRDQPVNLMQATEKAVLELVDEICARTDLTPILAMALISQTQTFLLKKFGGPEAQGYCIALTEDVFSESDEERQKSSARIEALQSLMLDHFNLYVADAGRAQ